MVVAVQQCIEWIPIKKKNITTNDQEDCITHESNNHEVSGILTNINQEINGKCLHQIKMILTNDTNDTVQQMIL